MIVVGINLDSTKYNKKLKDGGVCIIEDGDIVFAISEERISRMKRDGGFQKALNYSLETLKLNAKDIDVIAYSSCCEKIRSNFRIKGFENVKTISCNHHYAHALSVYLTSPFSESIVLVCDAGGNILDTESDRWWAERREQQSYYIAKGNKIELHSTDFEEPRAAGIAEIYRAFTYYLGWQSSNYASKVMSLAAYGDSSLFQNKTIFSIDDSNGKLNSTIKNNPRDPISMVKELISINSSYLIPSREPDSPITSLHRGLSFWIQSETEKALITKINWLIKKTGISNICLAGGVAYNCSAIGKLLENTLATNIYVHPASGDHGQCLGNAIYGYISENGIWNRKFSPYLGGEESLTLDRVLNYIKSYPFLRASKRNNIFSAVAQLLRENKIVAWFQGRSEYGPRALGNRSILANPANLNVRDRLNLVKLRESFMPFAPSVMWERANDFFEIPFESPYMTAAFKVKKDKAHIIPAVVHENNTARIQMVRREHNPKFYDLIKEFYNLTGIPLILNTSFNGPGEPIVESFSDALDSFSSLDIDCLVAGDLLIERIPGKTRHKIIATQNFFQIHLDSMPIGNLRQLLYKKFPFIDLVCRDKFKLYSEYVEWLKTGRKITTIRFRQSNVEYPDKSIMPLYATESFNSNSTAIYVGDINITSLSIKKFKDLDLNDARNDGFKSLNELRTTLMVIYPDISGQEFVSIYGVKLAKK